MLFNDLLNFHQIDPTKVKIYRHIGKDRNEIQTWFEDRASLEAHQNEQNRNHFSQDFFASFLVNSLGETVFMGLYKILNRQSVDKKWHYETEPVPLLEEYAGLLVINWNEVYSARQTSPYASNYPFKIIEIKKTWEQEFPGFYEFEYDVQSVAKMNANWKQYLKKTKGIYLLTCKNDRTCQYVGKASGENGLLGRWENYDKPDEVTLGEKGDGGNILLKAHNKTCDSGYWVTLLEEVSWNITTESICAKEQFWMNKLKTKQVHGGLNAN